MRVDTALQVFIDEVNDEYYSSYKVDGGETIHPLTDADLIELPLTPAELRQGYIKVWS